MNPNCVTSSDLLSWIETFLDGQSFNDYKITLTGKSGKDDGYLGEVVFATVDGISKENERKVLDLVIKHGKKNDHLRKTLPIRNAFEKEIHIYEKVFPGFKKLQREKNVKNGFESVPRCYMTLLFDNMEVIILDNLKTLGYEVHDKYKPLNLHHLKLVATEYAKLHAFSFALRDQQNESFDSIVGNKIDVLQQFLLEEGVEKSVQQCTDDALAMLKQRNYVSLYNKFRNLLVKRTSEMLMDLWNEKEPQAVITHGDCWNNNFMFKYKNEDRTSPSEVAILDWQLSRFHSPAFDLVFLMYANSSQEGLDKFDDVMETYYRSFSHFLRELGSNPDELFTFLDLKRHWKKYSLFGVLFMPMLLQFALCTQEEAPAFEELQEGEGTGSRMFIEMADKGVYFERITAMIRHYFEYVF